MKRKKMIKTKIKKGKQEKGGERRKSKRVRNGKKSKV